MVNSPSHKLKERVKLVFQLTQHIRDEQLISSLVQYFDCGILYENRQTFDFLLKFSDINEKIIPDLGPRSR